MEDEQIEQQGMPRGGIKGGLITLIRVARKTGVLGPEDSGEIANMPGGGAPQQISGVGEETSTEESATAPELTAGKAGTKRKVLAGRLPRRSTQKRGFLWWEGADMEPARTRIPG